VVEQDERLGDDEAALGQFSPAPGQPHRRLEPRDVVIAEVAEDRQAGCFGLREIDEARAAAREGVAPETTILDRPQQEARPFAAAQPEVGPVGREEVGGDDCQCVHGKQKDPPAGRSASGAACV
jgi:hypothetical protein